MSCKSFRERALSLPDRFVFDDVRQDWYDKKTGYYESEVTDNGWLWYNNINPYTGTLRG